ncbi:hypothetical protein CEXT_153911 [Caerostris extrusa]|uniref:Uncharacterized protein n=1 Tax=Caerostris extrusa TaxID=172846 RepID=A0AAV4WAW7_CAEEX|nr:hypothetical protein CEXT_153911 [Caerostris extrusa]
MRYHVLYEISASQFIMFCVKPHPLHIALSCSVQNLSFQIFIFCTKPQLSNLYILYETSDYSQCILMFCVKPHPFTMRYHVLYETSSSQSSYSVRNLIFFSMYCHVMCDTSSSNNALCSVRKINFANI